MLKVLAHHCLLPPIGERTAGRAIAVVTVGLAIVLGLTVEFGSIRRQSSVCGPEASDVLQSMGTHHYATEQGNVVAQWKLAHMYATGKGLPRCDVRAFEYFIRIADSHADDDPDTPQAAFVADAGGPLNGIGTSMSRGALACLPLAWPRARVAMRN
jgi:hypothetical protein